MKKINEMTRQEYWNQLKEIKQSIKNPLDRFKFVDEKHL